MKLLANCPVSNAIELQYAKTTLRNIAKHHASLDHSFLEFAAMELGTNLIKHAGGGHIWILLDNDRLALASVDNGPGIKNAEMARRQGHSSLSNSLGLGLYSLSEHIGYYLDIVSFCTDEGAKFSGTVLTLVESTEGDKKQFYFTQPLYEENYNGDFFSTKGRHIFIGDVSGHGKKAAESAKEAVEFFQEKPVSCLSIDNFFGNLHGRLVNEHKRGLAGCVIETTPSEWRVCGIGNVSIMTKREQRYDFRHFADGIVGEVLRKVTSFSIKKNEGERLVAITDGIDHQKALFIINNKQRASDEALAVATMNFAGIHDDRSILILS